MNANDEGMYVFEQHPRIFCVILGVSGKQSGVSGNQSGNGKSGPFWIRFPGVCFSHQLQSANAAWGGCEPYTPDEDTGAEFTAWKWAAWKKSRKGLLGKLLNR